ncbi:hypothetical protein BN137_4285 [Cronobacter condimenti 1330]|uniref:Uncharacterized protein n=1 Tax=Cronobacter condimenti 1330 TaxID=1073999 RepID=K8AGE5_9ENTR|nr:hypothetical protein BN137_4285 [Cronobacter condimenti 1330]
MSSLTRLSNFPVRFFHYIARFVGYIQLFCREQAAKLPQCNIVN